jgi:hypothetical protein
VMREPKLNGNNQRSVGKTQLLPVHLYSRASSGGAYY